MKLKLITTTDARREGASRVAVTSDMCSQHASVLVHPFRFRSELARPSINNCCHPTTHSHLHFTSLTSPASHSMRCASVCLPRHRYPPPLASSSPPPPLEMMRPERRHYRRDPGTGRFAPFSVAAPSSSVAVPVVDVKEEVQDVPLRPPWFKKRHGMAYG